MLKLARRARGHFVTLIEIFVHIIAHNSVLNRRHHLEALGNKLVQILIFIPQSLEMMPFV